MTVTAPTDLEVTKLSGVIGAEIRGVDLRYELADETVAEIRRILLAHKVIFFPSQHLEPSQHLAFAKRFGEPTPAHPVIPGIKDFPEVFEIDYTAARKLYESSNLDPGPGGYNAGWHTDVTFVERPPLGSILNAVVIPPAGGDTQWTNQQAAYEALSPPIRALLDGLTAIHSGERQFGAILRKREGGGDWEGEKVTSLDPVEHPVVRTHPETSARVLFVNPGFTQRIKDLSLPESDALLQFLYRHSTRPEFTVRYHWAEGDLAFWDNRVTQHSVVQDLAGAHRVIQRVTLRGDKPA